MVSKRLWVMFSLLIIAALVFGACTPSAVTPAAPAGDAAATDATDAAATDATTDAAPAAESSVQIPDIQEGMYNVAFVYVGPHDDGGWSQSHDVGRQYVEANLENVHTAYIENVAEGADAEQVIRSLAQGLRRHLYHLLRLHGRYRDGGRRVP